MMKTILSLLVTLLVAPFALAGSAPDAPQKEPSCSTETEEGQAGIQLSRFDLTAFRERFNRDADKIRIVTLLSPTCSMCRKGGGVVRSLLEEFPTEKSIRASVIWLPILPRDDEEQASKQAALFVDERTAQTWDGDRASGLPFQKALGLESVAWDVYLVYARGVRWSEDTPPKPTFWMHQLREKTGADQKSCLNPRALADAVRQLLQGQVITPNGSSAAGSER